MFAFGALMWPELLLANLSDRRVGNLSTAAPITKTSTRRCKLIRKRTSGCAVLAEPAETRGDWQRSSRALTQTINLPSGLGFGSTVCSTATTGTATHRSQRRVAEFYYTPRLRKVRIEPGRNGKAKEFIWEHLEGASWQLGDAGLKERPLYANALFRQRDQLGIALGFEGEAKCDLAGTLGYPAFSFKDLTRAQCAKLAGLDVILWPDKDASGDKQCNDAAQIQQESQQPRMIRLITPPAELPPCGDIVDAVKVLGWDKPKIDKLIAEAKEWQPPKNLNASRFTQETEHLAPHFSEEDLALRFSSKHADDLRHVAGLGKWLRWDGTRWREDDTLQVFDLARKVCREAAVECEGEKPNAAPRLAAAATVAAVERLARADRCHAASIEQWDKDPWLLNTPTRTVDLRSGEQREHRQGDYLTKLTGAGLAPESQDCPLWHQFLDRITDHNAELQKFLQRVVGYCLTGITREHALFFLYGSGANGKTVFLSTVAALLGEYAKAASIGTFMATGNEQHPTDLAGLRGARLVTAMETEDGRKWAESKIKALTGGDRIAARFMRQDFFEFTPQFKLLIAGNHKPGLRSVDEAIRRRLHLIPYKLRWNDPLAPADIQELEKMLLAAGAGTADDINRAKDENYRLGLFLRSLVGLDRQAAKRAFDSFLNGKKPTANQIEFINLMIDHLTQRGWMEPSLLYESPFTDINPRGVEGVFNDTEVTQLLAVLTSVREHASV
jgi:P4 family phage/plasmid primase-like protien